MFMNVYYGAVSKQIEFYMIDNIYERCYVVVASKTYRDTQKDGIDILIF